MELVTLKNVSIESKIELLRQLGYGSDGVHVLDNDGKKLVDEYSNEVVRLDNMLILPGSTVIIDDNPLSVASFVEEYGEII